MPVSNSNTARSIHNAAKQLRAAYPSTVGVTNATVKQE